MLTGYALTPLGALPGLTLESFAFGINDQGAVTGGSASEANYHGFYWQNGVLTDLGDLPGGHSLSIGNDVNEASVVAGMSYADSGDRAIIWQSGVGLTNLGDLPGGGDWSTATGINDAGQVSGHSQAASGYRAFRWQSGSGMTDLGDLPGGGDYSHAFGINGAGRVVGYSGAVTGDRAYVWQSGVGMTDLGDLVGGDNASIAYAINDAGQVIGESGAATGTHAFLWNSATGMIDLGDLPGGADQSVAFGINNASQVVGSSRAADGERAVIWSSDTGLQDLNSLVDASGAGWRLTRGRAINNLGQIVGGGIDPAGVIRAFLLTPLPSVLSAGGPYTVTEGESLSLTASIDPAFDPQSYTWDVNGNGVYGDALGISPTLTWAQLEALGINNGPDAVAVRVRATSVNGTETSDPASLTVLNAPPVVTPSGPSSVVMHHNHTIVIATGDASSVDAAFLYIEKDPGTGVFWAPQVYGESYNHSMYFSSPGTHQYRVRVSDPDGGLSSIASLTVEVSNVGLVENAGMVDLWWYGSTADDEVRFEEIDPGVIQVTTTRFNGLAVNEVRTFTGVTGRLTAYANSGNDIVDASGLNTIPAKIDGSLGSDRLFGGGAADELSGGLHDNDELTDGNNIIEGGAGDDLIVGNRHGGGEGGVGNNLLIGGDGDDQIYGNSVYGGEGGGGFNLIVGGNGNDTIHAYRNSSNDGSEGGAKDSILISGDTTLSIAGLEAILSEWSSARDVSARVQNILGNGSGPRNNGSSFLISGLTVLADGAPDRLIGPDNFDSSDVNVQWLWYEAMLDAIVYAEADDLLSTLV